MLIVRLLTCMLHMLYPVCCVVGNSPGGDGNGSGKRRRTASPSLVHIALERRAFTNNDDASSSTEAATMARDYFAKNKIGSKKSHDQVVARWALFEEYAMTHFEKTYGEFLKRVRAVGATEAPVTGRLPFIVRKFMHCFKNCRVITSFRSKHMFLTTGSRRLCRGRVHPLSSGA